MARYVIDPNDEWRDDDEVGFKHGVRLEVRALIDTRSGHRYEFGASRVSCPGERTRVFKGETAWSEARALAYDYETIRRFK